MTKEKWILIGPRASGKTTIGKTLSSLWSLEFKDLDDWVTARSGKSPSDWLNEGRLDEFRHWESTLLREWINSETGFLSTGGGTATIPEATILLESFAPVIWLKNAANSRIKIQQSQPRPRLVGSSLEEEVQTLDAERNRIYDWVSDESVDTDASEEAVITAFAALRSRFFTANR